ncbi:MAG: HAD-IA family hydrolase [Pseudomonadota bacterium]
MNPYDLIIFDCDGTLMDSEYLNNKVAAEVLTNYGLDGYTTEICLRDFAGHSWTEIKQMIDAKHNIDLPQSVIQTYIDTVQIRMKEELDVVEGALDFVSWSHERFTICVGSNGERSNVMRSLSIGGFDPYFSDENIFTKIQVANAKPAPDLFLFAAEKMEHHPKTSLVIEDSVSGVRAGVAAGMDVIGFTGAAHDKNQAELDLKQAGATMIFDQFIHIQQYLEG